MSLLALDLGLRLGFALYDGTGRLQRYGSRHFPSRGALKAAVFPMLQEVPRLDHLVAEGSRSLAHPWLKEAAKRGAATRLVAAETWRPHILLQREQRSGAVAKTHADRLAREIIREDGLSGPTSLNDDAAEAILLGLWAVRELGWRT